METMDVAEPVTRSFVAVVAAIRALLIRDLAPLQFFQEVTRELASGQAGSLAGMWMAAPNQPLILFADHDLHISGLLENRRWVQANQELLLKGWQSAEPLLLEFDSELLAGPNQCLLLPVCRGDQRVGVLQLLTSGIAWGEDPRSQRSAAMEIADCIERYLKRVEEQTIAINPEAFQTTFCEFSHKLHQTLDPQQVAVTAVNETCARLGCERAWLFEQRGQRWVINAVSGQKQVRQLSPQVRSLTKLVNSVASRKSRFLFTGTDLELPASVTNRLMDYLHESGVQMLLLEPLIAPHPDTNEVPSPSVHVSGILVCEQFQDNLPAPGMMRHIEAWSQQIALAVRNSRRHHRLLLLPGMQFLSQAYDGIKSSRPLIALACVLMLALLITGMTCTQQELQVSSRGHLMPVLQRRVFTPLEGDIVEVFVSEAEVVTQGQPLLRIRSTALELNELTLTSQLQERIQNRDALRAGLRTALAERERNESARVQAQIESLSIDINSLKQRLELLAQEQSKLVILSPINGTVTTSQPRMKLLNRPVQRGETLLEVMDQTGPWRIELKIPESRAGHVLQQFASQAETSVKFRTSSHPEQVQHTRVSAIGDRTSLSSDFGTVVNAYCEIGPDSVPDQRIGADVTAQIRCGPRNLLFIYFGELWEFLQRGWWI